MSNPFLEPERLLSYLSHRPGYLLNAMITITSPPEISDSILRDRVWTGRDSSLGILHRLPPEIMSILLDMLDIQSITRFASISSQGSTVVQSHRAYRDLVTFAPHVLVALRRVGLIGLHPVAELYTALRTEKCATCIEYGAFLFLPTCERCCWECLCCNPSFRLLLPKEAKRYFGLSERHLQQLPTLQVIPGKYGIRGKAAPENCRLVSAKAARTLGLRVHGSSENLAQAMARRCKSARFLVTGRYLQGGSAPTGAQDLLVLPPSQGNIPIDNFFGFASIQFPSILKSGRIEDGLWCGGCQVTLSHYDSLRLPKDVLAGVVPSDCDAKRVLLGLARRARSKESLLDHVKHCYGACKLVSELATTISV